jgi:hypothetical protein
MDRYDISIPSSSTSWVWVAAARIARGRVRGRGQWYQLGESFAGTGCHQDENQEQNRFA